jgi:hypothetical protein
MRSFAMTLLRQSRRRIAREVTQALSDIVQSLQALSYDFKEPLQLGLVTDWSGCGAERKHHAPRNAVDGHVNPAFGYPSTTLRKSSRIISLVCSGLSIVSLLASPCPISTRRRMSRTCAGEIGRDHFWPGGIAPVA